MINKYQERSNVNGVLGGYVPPLEGLQGSYGRVATRLKVRFKPVTAGSSAGALAKEPSRLVPATRVVLLRETAAAAVHPAPEGGKTINAGGLFIGGGGIII
jgi:hypothetical protein